MKYMSIDCIERYELKALQAQINPHFLYNTLSMMNWMAIRSGQMEISKVTLALSTFYRTALSKGKTWSPSRPVSEIWKRIWKSS